MSENVVEVLRRIYWAYPWLSEQVKTGVQEWLQLQDSSTPNYASIDDKHEFDALFSEHRGELLSLYRSTRETMRAKPYASCAADLEFVVFLQFVVARALWHYQFDVGDELEYFARQFDRLDALSERQRFFAEAQIVPGSREPN